MFQVFFFLLGICVGSFLNVLIDRLPKGQSVLFGRSRCDHCRRTLRWFELIPVVSYVIQGGKCRRCRGFLSLQYPVIEIATGVLFIASYLFYPYSLAVSLIYALILSSLLVIFVSDIKYTIIPDTMIIFGLAASVIYLLLETGAGLTILNRIASAVFSAMIFLLIWRLSRGKGMGFGDVKLIFLLGFISGFPLILVVLYSGFLTGAIAGVILILLNIKSLKSHIAFGPFLLFGYLISVLWGKQIVNYWMYFLR